MWTPDGERIAYGAGPDGVLWKAADGSGVAERIVETLVALYFFSPSGAELVFRATDANDSQGIGMISVEGNGDTQWLFDSEFTERNAELSPDGNWIAYQSNESDEFEIFVSPFPNVADGKQQVSNDGGVGPVWAKSGQELFYLELGAPPRLMTVPVQTGPTFTPGNPETVFEWDYYFVAQVVGRSYDVSPDGKRFLVIAPTGADGDALSPQIITVLNWFEELRRLVPVP